MEIVSLQFTAFVLLVLCGYYLLATRAQNYWLLLTSYVFYALCAWQFVPVLVLVTVASYAIARQLGTASRYRTQWLWAGIALNVGALVVLRQVFHATPFVGPFIVIGLSFYSLQAMSYLFDMYSGTLRASHSLADVALYLAYFPKLVAGPIERAPSFLPKLAQPRIVDDAALARGATLIAVGVTRKLVIADPLAALLPAGVFTSPVELGPAVLAASVVGYAFVLYNDFAGYTSIARGVSSFFGIELSQNFAQPFFARSFSEFWNRWHITLTHWLRDYIYLPVSRALLRRNLSRWNVPNLILPPLASMLTCGLWHGGSLHMLLWGGLHGVYLIAERCIDLLHPSKPGLGRPIWQQLVAALIVFLLGCWALVSFRMELGIALRFWQRILSGPSGPLPDTRFLLYMLPSLWLDFMQRRHGDDTVFAHWPRLPRAALLALAILLWWAMSRGRVPTPFVYQGF